MVDLQLLCGMEPEEAKASLPYFVFVICSWRVV